MSALFLLLFFAPQLWLLSHIDGVYGTVAPVPVQVSPPENVTVVSLNTNYTLTWDWSPSPGRSHQATFTAQYVGAYELVDQSRPPDWVGVCEGVAALSCDLTGLDLHYLGLYVFRVRADWNGRHSRWVQVKFCPETDADLGPPVHVDLRPVGNRLDVEISEPRSSQDATMREHLDTLYYHLLYWEQLPDGQVPLVQRLNSSASLLTLPALRSWTLYCVSVQSRHDGDYRKRSSFTLPRCVRTEGPLPWWQICLYFLSVLLLMLLLLLLLFCCSFHCSVTVKNTWFPSSQLPTHLEQYLRHSSGSDPPHLLPPHSELELLCDKVTICTEPEVLVEQDPDPGGVQEVLVLSHSRPRRQGSSSSSGDSGVYSTGGSSSQPSMKLTFDLGAREVAPTVTS